jgi:NAD(P)H-dependent FMN reductase
MRIEIISGSPRQESVTVRVAKFLETELKQRTEHEIGLIDLREWELPHVEKVYSSVDSVPVEWRPIAERIFKADAFILVTPEYNGSYAPSLKNLLDHFPKQIRKPFGLVTASPGAFGGIRATQQLLVLVPALFGIASPHLLVVPQVDKKFDENNNLIDQSFMRSIDNFIAEYLWLAESLNPKVQITEKSISQ